MAIFNEVKFEDVFDLSRCECTCHVLLVAENHQRGAGQLLLEQQPLQLGLTVLKSQPVAGIDDPDETIRVLEVIAPIRPDGRLASDIPEVEFEVGMLNCLDLEA